MDKPPGSKPPPNATIQIDRVDLDEILLLDNGNANAEEPMAASVPPPLPPEELARAASLAPIGSMAPAAPAKPGRGLFIALGFLAILAVAITAGVVVGNAVRTVPKPVSASTPSTTPTETAPTQTITIHTMELGGKETAADE
jgi:hypothetical protein